MEKMILKYKKELIEIEKQLGWNKSKEYQIQLLERTTCIRDFISSLERVLANDSTSEKDLRVCEVSGLYSKSVDDYYKEWYGESHLNTSNVPTHDSSEAADFADYYYKEKSEPLKVMLNKILSIEDAAFGLKGFDYQRLKSEIRGALSDAS